MSKPKTHTLQFTRVFNAPREDVFRAFSDPEAIKSWWAPKGWVTPYAEMDVRAGGRYRFGMCEEAGGDLMFVHGNYIAVEPPARLVFTYVWEGGVGGERWCEHGLIEVETVVTLEFRDHGERTELLLRHEGFPTMEGRDQHRNGWGSNWDSLDDFVVRGIVKSSDRV